MGWLRYAKRLFGRQTRPPADGRPKVLLSGWFARGNAGDEALLHVQYELLSPHFEVVIGVEHPGTRFGYLCRYPYDRCRVVPQSDWQVPAEPDVIALHVGGGDLPIAYNGAQVLGARAAGKPIFRTGIDLGGTHRRAARVDEPWVAEQLRSAELTSVRTRRSAEFFAGRHSAGHLGADWAYGLGPEPPPTTRRPEVLLVLRDFPRAAVTPEFRAGVAAFVRDVRRQGRRVVCLPFGPDDQRFLRNLPEVRGLPRFAAWWEPRRIRRRMSEAELTVSVGRLHPLIFAATVGAPAVQLELPTDAFADQRDFCKLAALREEAAFPVFPDWDTLRRQLPHLLNGGERLPGSGGRFEPARFGRDYAERYRDMTERLLSGLRRAA